MMHLLFTSVLKWSETRTQILYLKLGVIQGKEVVGIQLSENIFYPFKFIGNLL
jgi:hypothetical protein